MSNDSVNLFSLFFFFSSLFFLGNSDAGFLQYCTITWILTLTKFLCMKWLRCDYFGIQKLTCWHLCFWNVYGLLVSMVLEITVLHKNNPNIRYLSWEQAVASRLEWHFATCLRKRCEHEGPLTEEMSWINFAFLPCSCPGKISHVKMFSCTSCLPSHMNGGLVKSPPHSVLVMVKAVACVAGTLREESDLGFHF